MTKIKICGLSRECDIVYANELMPDYIGYVFWEKSRRNVTPGQAAELTGKLEKKIVPVGVFVDADAHFAAGLANEGIIRMIQLHGHEDEEYIQTLRRLTDVPIIKAYKVRRSEDVQLANVSSADYVLLDNGYGTGQSFDWQYVKEAKRLFFLAGGINNDNVQEILQNIKPFAVDISSGVETDGYKDYEKMKAFVKAVRSIDK